MDSSGSTLLTSTLFILDVHNPYVMVKGLSVYL